MIIDRFFLRTAALGLGLLSLAWLTPASVAAPVGDIPFARDIGQDARAAQAKGAPLLVMFTAENCPYCERVRQEFLLPMVRHSEYGEKVVVRQIEVRGREKLLDFAGQPTTHGQFAKRYKIKLTPTIQLFDAAGHELTEPLIGLTTPDFYGVYLERAVDEAVEKIHKSPSAL